MKTLMVDVVNHTYTMMFGLFGIPDKAVGEFLDSLRKRDPQPDWDEPKMPFSVDPESLDRMRKIPS